MSESVSERVGGGTVGEGPEGRRTLKKKVETSNKSGGGFFPVKLADGCQIPRPMCVTEELAAGGLGGKGKGQILEKSH